MKEWQELKMDFFVDEILERYWKGKPGTLDKVIEFQFFPALITGEPDRRVFLGYTIKPWLDIASQKSKDVQNRILANAGVPGLREFEEDYAVGLTITDPEHDKGHIDIAPFSRGNQKSYNILLASSFGYSLGEDVESFPVVLWFNPGKKENGEPFYDFKDTRPHKDRMVRVRVWEENEFWKIIHGYLKNNKFSRMVKKDDPGRVIEV